MVNKFRHRRPFYPDDSDYNTNAPSYYDDLARKTKLIKLLAEKIWEYDEELAKRFAEWDKNLEDFPEDVKLLLEKWLEDGTLGDILTDVFLSGKSNIVTSEAEPQNANNQTYWFQIVDSINGTDGLIYEYIKESRVNDGR